MKPLAYTNTSIIDREKLLLQKQIHLVYGVGGLYSVHITFLHSLKSMTTFTSCKQTTVGSVYYFEVSNLLVFKNKLNYQSKGLCMQIFMQTSAFLEKLQKSVAILRRNMSVFTVTSIIISPFLSSVQIWCTNTVVINLIFEITSIKNERTPQRPS